MKLKHLSLIALSVLMPAASSRAQDLQITSFGDNGLLSWTNTFSNGVYSVEWTGALTTNVTWQQGWLPLENLTPTSETTTVTVPMFYRVRCLTNGVFFPMPLGHRMSFTVTNAVSSTWTQQIHSIGVLSVPSQSNQYAFASVSSPSETSAYFFRSTDQACFITPNGDNEQLRWTNAPVGTTFTFRDKAGVETSTILSTSATVAVPAGTFDNCLVFSNRCPNCSDAHPYWIEYVKPGMGLVYWLNWGVDNPPDVYQLQSVTDTRP